MTRLTELLNRAEKGTLAQPGESPMQTYYRLTAEASWFRTEAEMDEGQGRDLDETRRLLYMALLRPRSDRWQNIAGTLVNALAHHGLGIDPDEAMRHLTALCDEGEATESEAWARALIERITSELGQ